MLVLLLGVAPAGGGCSWGWLLLVLLLGVLLLGVAPAGAAAGGAAGVPGPLPRSMLSFTRALLKVDDSGPNEARTTFEVRQDPFPEVCFPLLELY